MKTSKVPLGTGQRFDLLVSALSKKKGSRRINNPSALAAAIGRKKYGKARFQKLASSGRRRVR